MKTQVMIADDHPIVRNGLKQLIAGQSDLELMAEAMSGDEVMARLREAQPDVLVMDMSMPGRSGIDLIQAVKNHWPKLPVLVLSVHDDDLYVVRTIKAGAMGYLTKSSPAEDLLAAIRRVARGRLYINEDLAEKLALQLLGGEKSHPHDVLSDREQQVMRRLAAGDSVSEIARDLHLSVKTISTHKTNVMQKMGFANISELIRYALENGLVDQRSRAPEA